jgi:hypothetical protein
MLNKLICKVLGHKFAISARLAPGYKLLTCRRCGAVFKGDGGKNLEPWGGEFNLLDSSPKVLAFTVLSPPERPLDARL